ncbi:MULTISPECIES: phosphoenolpyruvate--protein phosphotransferase [unclassified Microbacterium]|uniref:phosphoenolpyruvate--protein phosphotransferase n=1 Tax=unclassified Microbacterium TaxID=2609290 RepID=UPI00300FDD42
MTRLSGSGIGLGVAVGPVARMAEPEPDPVDEDSALGADAERARAREAIAATVGDLTARAAAAEGTAAEVLEAQAMMAEDPTLSEAIDARIDAGATAEWSVHAAIAEFREQLAGIGGYLGERAADLTDVSRRVLASLRGRPAPGLPVRDEPYVLVARDLAPADTAGLDRATVLALVTADGGPTSHTAILAREMGIPAVVAVGDVSSCVDGETVIVDAAQGAVVVAPGPKEREEAERRADERRTRAGATGPGVLADGHPVPLLANLGSPAEAPEAARLGAEGVGLFRTEFLFLGARHAPTRDHQVAAYRELFRAFAGKKVVVRVLDAGADKPLPFLTDGGEENPALGRRGLRALRAHEEILRTQLEALAVASADSEVELWVMAPMVSTAEEAAYFAALAHEHGIRAAGVMIEVPSSALIADRILRHADFASIGTNDLTQYTLAADRQLGTVASLQDPWHPAVLRLVREVGVAGRAAGRAVGVCGEAAADPLLAVVLVGLGAGTLSMAPSAIGDVRLALSRVTRTEAERAAVAALAAEDAAAAKAAAQAVVAASG